MSEDTVKDRSPRSPAVTLQKCLEYINKMHTECRRNAVAPETAARSIGYATLHGGVLSILASLREYGLIERPDSKVVVTALSVRILHPTSDAQKSEAIKESALTPKLFKGLMDGFADCSQNVLESHLVQTGFTPDRAKQVAKVFIENKAFAKLEAGSNVDVPNSGSDDDGLAEKAQKEAEVAASALALTKTQLLETAGSHTLPSSTLTPPSGNSFSFKGEMLAQYNIPLGGNQAYLAFTGKELVPEDFDALIDFVEFTKKQFVRALAREQQAKDDYFTQHGRPYVEENE